MSLLKNKYSTSLGGNLSNEIWSLPLSDKQISIKNRIISQEGIRVSSPCEQIHRDSSLSPDYLNEAQNFSSQVVSSNQVEMENVCSPANDSSHSMLWHEILGPIKWNCPSLQEYAFILSSAFFANFILTGFRRLSQDITKADSSSTVDGFRIYAIGLFIVGSCALVRNQRPILIAVSYLLTILLIATSFYQHFFFGNQTQINNGCLLQSFTSNLNFQDTTPPIQDNKTAFDFFAFTTANSDLPPNFVQAWWHMQHT